MKENISSVKKVNQIISENIKGRAIGIYSICSANPSVLETCINFAKRHESLILIESTCNQVNQFGGYTGTSPEQFVNMIYAIAREMGLPQNQVLLGGDHLGPYVWRNEPSEVAMEKAEILVRAYVQAGYQKIHIDTSMGCADDPKGQLNLETTTRRAVRLCKAAEETYKNTFHNESDLVYVFGSEVPTPGGQQTESVEIEVTKPEDAERTIEMTFNHLKNERLEKTLERVIGFVVQPGVEFGDHAIFEYQRTKALPLSSLISPARNFVFEAHSTDYQTRQKLKEMVEDHFAILKVGPALTYAMREAIFALAYIEEAILGQYDKKKSEIIEKIDAEMRTNPEFWVKHYAGTENDLQLSRKFSFLDRVRYYWGEQNIQNALQSMLNNLTRTGIPASLLSQFFPYEYENTRNIGLQVTPNLLIQLRITRVLEDYQFACEESNN